MRARKGFTLIEVSLAMLVFIITLITILLTYINAMNLTELSFNTTKATFSAETMLETIRNYNFTNVLSDYANFIFDPQGFTNGQAKGIVYVTQEGGREDLLRINVVICFRQGARIIGEDSDLDGILDAGEDRNANALLDSPVELTSLITERY